MPDSVKIIQQEQIIQGHYNQLEYNRLRQRKLTRKLEAARDKVDMLLLERRRIEQSDEETHRLLNLAEVNLEQMRKEQADNA